MRNHRLQHRHLSPEALAPAGLCCSGHRRLSASSADLETSVSFPGTVSQRIERATYRDIGVRYVASNCHPDHDTICAFRRNNFEAVAKAFEQVLLLAKELKLLRLGTVSVDGTKVDANSNKRNNVRYDRAQELRGEIKALLDRAEQEDSKEAVDTAGTAAGVVAA